MGDGYHRAGILAQVLLQPVDALCVEMVGRLVEQQHVGLLEQKAAQSHTAAFAAAQGGHGLVVGRTLQGVHRAFELAVDVPRVGGVEFVLKFGLACEQRVEVGVRVGESLVHTVEFGKHVHDRLHALAHDVYHRLFRVESGILLEVAYRVAGREHHFSLVFLVDAGDNLQ